jgi:glutamine cyclotransferase
MGIVNHIPVMLTLYFFKISPFLLVATMSLLYSCNDNSTKTGQPTTELIPAIPVINYAVVKSFPHDITSYTEGLLMHNGRLFESTGSPEGLDQARSLVGITDLTTGKIDIKIELDRTQYFGEGITILKDKLYQLTYKNQVCFVYDANSFKQVGRYNYSNKEGWSLTTNGTELIMSDGTDKLTILQPDGFTPIKQLAVTENGIQRDSLNELEYINGFIYANIWLTNHIVKIDPSNGKVVGKLDLHSLNHEAKSKHPGADVLNGIAYDNVTDKIFVTGKLWPDIYQISFSH